MSDEIKNNYNGLLKPQGGARWQGYRSYLDDPYHFCARCGSRQHIKNLEWQRGLLLCKTFNCVDKHPLIGEREAAVAHALEVPTEELKPDPKLITPTVGDDSSGDEILF